MGEGACCVSTKDNRVCYVQILSIWDKTFTWVTHCRFQRRDLPSCKCQYVIFDHFFCSQVFPAYSCSLHTDFFGNFFNWQHVESSISSSYKDLSYQGVEAPWSYYVRCLISVPTWKFHTCLVLRTKTLFGVGNIYLVHLWCEILNNCGLNSNYLLVDWNINFMLLSVKTTFSSIHVCIHFVNR